jgi:1-deoxy-D-xylulose-5-phosphate reductoisomerase
LIPLDSEHFSLFNSNIKKSIIFEKIYITASGGPFYFKKNINLSKVTFKNVIAHPKWKMGVNNSIDSSNFINKFLEIYELSIYLQYRYKKNKFFSI